MVGAVCINIDVNYISDYVRQGSAERTAEFFRQYCHRDMKLEENILSKGHEYRRAQAGKRHFRDAGPRDTQWWPTPAHPRRCSCG